MSPTHLIKQATQAPDVRLVIIGGRIDLLWCHVVWSSDFDREVLRRLSQYSAQAEVADLNRATRCQEDVLGLQITVDDAFFVKSLQTERKLEEVSPDEGLV